MSFLSTRIQMDEHQYKLELDTKLSWRNILYSRIGQLKLWMEVTTNI